MKKIFGVLFVVFLLINCNINKQLPMKILRDSLTMVMDDNMELMKALISKTKQCKEDFSRLSFDVLSKEFKEFLELEK